MNVILYVVQASKKKMMIKEGKLDKFGRTNDTTPKDWSKSYTDLRYSTHTLDISFVIILLHFPVTRFFSFVLNNSRNNVHTIEHSVHMAL